MKMETDELGNMQCKKVATNTGDDDAELAERVVEPLGSQRGRALGLDASLEVLVDGLLALGQPALVCLSAKLPFWHCLFINKSD